MLRILRNRWSAGLTGLGLVMFVLLGCLRGDDPKPDAAKTDDAKQEAAKKDDAKKDDAQPTDSADLFKVPDGKPQELLDYIKKVSEARPTEAKSREDILAFVAKSRAAILAAADKILATKPEGEIRLAAIRAKFEAYTVLEQINDDAQAAKQGKALAEELKADKQADVAKLAKRYLLMSRINEAASGNGDTAKVWEDVKAAMAEDPNDMETIQLAMSLVHRLEYDEKSAAQAAQCYRDLKEILAKNKDPQIAAYAATFDGVIRRLSLPGHPVEIKGNVIGGKPLDTAALKGKVVLIDFWATWCGPCRAELPNVLRNYAKYHDKGFEVVGISLDQDKAKLEKMIADEKIPWPIIFDDSPEATGQPEMASYYGVSSIPTVILTNQKGEVVSLNARGEELSQKLEELLGKAEEKK